MVTSESNDPIGAHVEDAASADERELRAALDRWVRAIRAHDLVAVCAERTDDIVMFDLPEPLRLRGIGEYRNSWLPYFAFDGSKEFQLQDFELVCGSDVAWAHALLRCEGSGGDGAIEGRLCQNGRPMVGVTRAPFRTSQIKRMMGQPSPRRASARRRMLKPNGGSSEISEV